MSEDLTHQEFTLSDPDNPRFEVKVGALVGPDGPVRLDLAIREPRGRARVQISEEHLEAFLDGLVDIGVIHSYRIPPEQWKATLELDKLPLPEDKIPAVVPPIVCRPGLCGQEPRHYGPCDDGVNVVLEASPDDQL